MFSHQGFLQESLAGATSSLKYLRISFRLTIPNYPQCMWGVCVCACECVCGCWPGVSAHACPLLDVGIGSPVQCWPLPPPQEGRAIY